MKQFKFPLDTVLKYRQMQLDLHRAKLEKLFSELRQIEEQKSALDQERTAADHMVKTGENITALNLVFLDNFAQYAGSRKEKLESERVHCFRRIADQQVVLLKAQQERDLLVQLKARRKSEWNVGVSRELEELASEAYLAKWVRESGATS